MKVLFVVQGFPSNKNPMAGNYEAVQAKSISDRGNEVMVLSIYWKSFAFFFSRKNISLRNVDGICVYEKTSLLPIIPFLFDNYFISRFFMRRSFVKLCQYVFANHDKPDIVHIHSLFVAKYGIVLKEKYGIPTIITEHWSGLNMGKVNKRLLADSNIYKQADKVVVVSQALNDALKNHFGINSEIIHNMVDNSFFEKRREKNNKKEFIFISVGRLVPIKCFDLLINAFSKMEHVDNVKLIIVGLGPKFKSLHNMIKQLGLEDRVFLSGYKSPHEVSDLLCQSDCFVLSSERETFGIVLIEAMAKGLPVISTKCGGPEDIINPSNGLMVPPKNPDEIARAMDYMVEHAKEYDENHIRDYCYNNFSQTKITNQILNAYQSVLSPYSSNGAVRI